jgi:wobble nucleotide-excising tRNase
LACRGCRPRRLSTPLRRRAALLFEFGGKNTPITFSNGAWNASVPQMVVFDAEFVEQNVYSGQEVRPEQRQALLEFALGDQAVKLQKQIGDLTKKISEETSRRGEAEKRIAGFSQQLPLAKFIALAPVPDAQQQIDALRKRVDAAKNAAALAVRQVPTVLVAPAFDTDAFFAVLAKKLADVEKDAEAMVRQHFAKHPAPRIEAWSTPDELRRRRRLPILRADARRSGAYRSVQRLFQPSLCRPQEAG